MATQCIAYALHEIFLFQGNCSHFMLHLEQIYDIHFIEFIIISRKLCLEPRLNKNYGKYIRSYFVRNFD